MALLRRRLNAAGVAHVAAAVIVSSRRRVAARWLPRVLSKHIRKTNFVDKTPLYGVRENRISGRPMDLWNAVGGGEGEFCPRRALMKRYRVTKRRTAGSPAMERILSATAVDVQKLRGWILAAYGGAAPSARDGRAVLSHAESRGNVPATGGWIDLPTNERR